MRSRRLSMPTIVDHSRKPGIGSHWQSSASALTLCRTIKPTPRPLEPCAGCTFKETWLGTLRGRVGYSFDRWLPYLTGGLAYGNMYIQGPSGGSENKTKAGWTLGAGVEYAFLGAWSTKLEYLYVNLGSATCGMATCGLATNEEVKFSASVVRVGLNYRF